MLKALGRVASSAARHSPVKPPVTPIRGVASASNAPRGAVYGRNIKGQFAGRNQPVPEKYTPKRYIFPEGPKRVPGEVPRIPEQKSGYKKYGKAAAVAASAAGAAIYKHKTEEEHKAEQEKEEQLEREKREGDTEVNLPREMYKELEKLDEVTKTTRTLEKEFGELEEELTPGSAVRSAASGVGSALSGAGSAVKNVFSKIAGTTRELPKDVGKNVSLSDIKALARKMGDKSRKVFIF